MIQTRYRQDALFVERDGNLIDHTDQQQMVDDHCQSLIQYRHTANIRKINTFVEPLYGCPVGAESQQFNVNGVSNVLGPILKNLVPLNEGVAGFNFGSANSHLNAGELLLEECADGFMDLLAFSNQKFPDSYPTNYSPTIDERKIVGNMVIRQFQQFLEFGWVE